MGLLQNAFIGIQKNSNKLLAKNHNWRSDTQLLSWKGRKEWWCGRSCVEILLPQIMPHLACLERHIVCLPIIFEYTAEDFINPVESLLGCADAEKLYFWWINYFQLRPFISSWQLDNVDYVSSSDSEPCNRYISY